MTMPLGCSYALRAMCTAGLFSAVAAYAQTRPPAVKAAEVSTRDVPITFKTKVNLVSIPVVARDSKGRAVGTLSREDFELSDNGKPQTISRFSVEKFGDNERVLEVPAAPTISRSTGPASSTPSINSTRPMAPQMSEIQAAQPAQTYSQPERFIAYVFDDVNSTPGDLSRVKEVGYQHMISSLHPTERAAVYATSGLGGADFTDDRGKLRKALNKITPQPSITRSSDCPPMTVYQAEAIVKGDGMALGAAMADFMSCGGNADNAEWRSRNAAREILLVADRNIRNVLANLDGVVKKLSMMSGRRTLLLVSSGFLMLDDRREEELALLERAVKAGVVVNSLDARALWALAPGLDASSHTTDSDISALPAPGGAPLTGGTSGSGGSSLLVKAQMARAEAFASRDIMAEVAANTGGRFFENSNDLQGAYERLASAPEYIYVLGFEPQNLKLDGKYHSLKVTLRNPRGLALEARRGYYAPRSLTDPGQQTKADVQEAFFSRSETNDIPVAVRAEVNKASGRESTVSVATKIDVRNLPFRKEAGINRDDVILVVGLFDSDGNYVKGTQKILELRLRDETLEGQLAKGFIVNNSFTAPPGTYLLRVVAHDSEGQNLTSQSSSVTIP